LLDQGLITLWSILYLFAILNISFISFAFLLKKIFIGVIKVEHFLNPLKPLFQKSLFMQKFKDHLIFPIKLLS